MARQLVTGGAARGDQTDLSNVYIQMPYGVGHGLIVGFIALIFDAVVPSSMLRLICNWLYNLECGYRSYDRNLNAMYIGLSTAYVLLYYSHFGERGMLRYSVLCNNIFGLITSLVSKLTTSEDPSIDQLQPWLVKSDESVLLMAILLWSICSTLFTPLRLMAMIVFSAIAFFVALFLVLKVPFFSWLASQAWGYVQEAGMVLYAQWRLYHKSRVDEYISQSLEESLMLLPYVYDERLGPNEIRVLEIQQKLYKPPECHLARYQIDESPEDRPDYFAISYTPESLEKSSLLTLADHTGARRRMMVTKSVYDIIHREASVMKKTCIWIDEISVNQDDFTEKTSEVAKTKFVFSRAVSVHAYLDVSLQVNFFPTASTVGRIAGKIRPGQRHQSLAAREQLGNFESNWTSRAWVVQEAVAANDICFINGLSTADRACWDTAVEGLDSFDTASMSSVDGILDDEQTQELSEGLLRAIRIHKLRAELQSKERLPLDILLSRYGDFKVRHRQDKIYAFLGLTNTEHEAVTSIDYSQPTRDVFVSVMHRLANSASNLDILVFAGLSQSDRPGDYPSWVSCWNGPSKLIELGQPQIYHAATSSTWGTNSQSDTEDVQEADKQDESIDTLSVPAKHVDTIKELGEVYEIFLSERISRKKAIDIPTHHVISQAWSLATANCTSSDMSDVNKLAQAFWTLLVLNSLRRFPDPDAVSLPAALSKFDRYYNIRGVLSSAPYQQEDGLSGAEQTALKALRLEIHRVIRRLSFTLMGNRFGVTKDGRMGIFPSESKVGDTVHLVASAQVPFVFRKKENAEESHDRYELVGPCQLHGAMDGELNDDQWEDCVLI